MLYPAVAIGSSGAARPADALASSIDSGADRFELCARGVQAGMRLFGRSFVWEASAASARLCSLSVSIDGFQSPKRFRD